MIAEAIDVRGKEERTKDQETRMAKIYGRNRRNKEERMTKKKKKGAKMSK